MTVLIIFMQVLRGWCSLGFVGCWKFLAGMFFFFHYAFLGRYLAFVGFWESSVFVEFFCLGAFCTSFLFAFCFVLFWFV